MARSDTATLEPPDSLDRPERSPKRVLGIGLRLFVLVPPVVLLAQAVTAGLDPAALLRALAAITLTQVVPGVVIWRSVRPRDGWLLEDLVMGFAIGIVLAVLAQSLAAASGLQILSWIVGPAVAVALLWRPDVRQRVRTARSRRLPAVWSAFVSSLMLLSFRGLEELYRTVPISWDSGFRSTYVDVPFHQALAGQLAHRGPFEMPHVLGVGLDYHWFSHAWIAQVSSAGVEIDQVLIRFLPVLMVIVAIPTVAVAAVRVSGRVWAGPLAALLATAAGHLDVFGGARPSSLTAPLSPSANLVLPVLVAVLVLLVVRWHRQHMGGTTLLLIVLSVGAAGLKGPALAVICAGTGLAALMSLVLRHEAAGRVVLDAVITALAFIASYVALFGGGSRGLGLDPARAATNVSGYLGIGSDFVTGSTAAVIVFALVTVVSVSARGVGALGVFLDAEQRRQPWVWLLVGAGIAGVGAVLLLSHTGQSQWYFLQAAVPAFAILSAAGILLLVERAGGAWTALAGVGLLLGVGAGVVVPRVGGSVSGIENDGAAALATVVYLAGFLALVTLGAALFGRLARSGDWRHASSFVVAVAVTGAALVPSLDFYLTRELADAGGPVEPTGRFAFSADQVEAARWLRDNSAAGDVVVTNRHCAAPNWVNCDARRFHVAAYTERRVLVEGWAYNSRWASEPVPELGAVYRPFWDEELLATNDRFFTADGGDVIGDLRDMGVRWAFQDLTVDDSDELLDHGVLRYETEWAKVYELRPPS